MSIFKNKGSSTSRRRPANRFRTIRHLPLNLKIGEGKTLSRHGTKELLHARKVRRKIVVFNTVRKI